MKCSAFRRWNLALALAVPSVAWGMVTSNTVLAEEQFPQASLYPVAVQTTAFQDGEFEPTPREVIESDITDAAMAPLQDVQPSNTALPLIDPQSLAGGRYCSKQEIAAAKAAMTSAYAGVFFANDFSYLSDPCYTGPRFWGDSLKNMQTRFGTLSLGGETRVRYHNERNHRGLGITGKDDNFWLSRQRLYADWRLNDLFRVYGEVLDANSAGETFAPRPIEENDLDIQNLFVDVNLLEGSSGELTARLGRQELLYGAQRLASPLDWANTRRTFQGVRMLYQNDEISLDGFWTQFVGVDPDDADEANEDVQFFGVYATQADTAVGQMENYYLGLVDDNFGFSYHTLGSRVSRASGDGLLYDFEGAYQFGENSDGSDHSAGFVTAGLGRKLQTRLLSPTVWLYYDFASGEEDFSDVARGDDGFDHLFPLAHKWNGFLDLFGRRNLHDLNVLTTTPLAKNVSLILWYHYFALAEDTTPYSVVMTPYNTTTQAESRELGHEIDVLLNINLTARTNVLIGYSHFSGGDYYDTPGILPPAAGDDADADFFYTQFQTRY